MFMAGNEIKSRENRKLDSATETESAVWMAKKDGKKGILDCCDPSGPQFVRRAVSQHSSSHRHHRRPSINNEWPGSASRWRMADSNLVSGLTTGLTTWGGALLVCLDRNEFAAQSIRHASERIDFTRP